MEAVAGTGVYFAWLSRRSPASSVRPLKTHHCDKAFCPWRSVCEVNVDEDMELSLVLTEIGTASGTSKPYERGVQGKSFNRDLFSTAPIESTLQV